MTKKTVQRIGSYTVVESLVEVPLIIMKPAFIVYHLATKKAAERKAKDFANSTANLAKRPCVIG